jgi:hypothetical protein
VPDIDGSGVPAIHTKSPFLLSTFFLISAFLPPAVPPRKRQSAAKPNSTSKPPRQTASWAGNSPNVIHRHYKALVKEPDAKEFWEITPDNVAQIIPMPAPAAAAAAQ